MDNHWNVRKTVVSSVIGGLFISVWCIAGDRDRSTGPRDVMLKGRIVDLHSFMTDRFESSDKVKCTRDCIRAGVPAAIETEEGLVVVGEGTKGAARTLAPLAYETAELTGKLYEKQGMRYIDITSAKVVKSMPEQGHEDEAEGTWAAETEEDSMGVCCLPGGTCIEITEDGCYNKEGSFYTGVTCEEIECEE